ncbi:DNA-directed RNA polymerase III subunit RPC3 [Trichinella pseudospiralis]|uniref:DNA-directed RNA polymerase III subunit RPC3 n=3 Tax=Trichinella pseudospiralis TaxID=6337 RepID=A0A0V1JX59_TRIPS|nr:DNA-directed RNA polymerase III subunit RPC3 [Trichinella pseudospiralis]KRZ39533.1 DNA-directed RNA polymerase III subunit RPC3 [Trichinella pseudospiralis]
MELKYTGRKGYELCILIIEEYFGKNAAALAKILMKMPCAIDLNELVQLVNLPPIEVRKLLRIFLRFDIVTFTIEEKIRIVYKIHSPAILKLLRYAEYMRVVHLLFGNIAEAVAFELLTSGKLSEVDCVNFTFQRLSKKSTATKSEVQQMFSNLVHCKVIKQCRVFNWSLVEDDSSVCLNQYRASNSESRMKKVIYWSVNFDFIENCLRQKLILDFITDRYDKTAAEVFCFMMDVNEIDPCRSKRSNLISHSEILKKYPGGSTVKAELPHYFDMFANDSVKLISVNTTVGSRTYTIEYASIFEHLCFTAITKLLSQRIDPKAAQLFRLIHAEDVVAQSELEHKALMSHNDVARYSYILTRDSFVEEIELPGADANSSCISFLMVDRKQAAKRALDETFRAIANCIHRRNAELTMQKELLHREEKCHTVCEMIRNDEKLDAKEKERQIAETQVSYITDAEKESLKNLNISVKKLYALQELLMHSLLLFETSLQYFHIDEGNV